MIYVTSDIHGCYEKYTRLMECLNLKEDDRLYILGDIVDRGGGGIEVIKDVMNRKNVVCLRGNHDYCASIFLK
jgi:serine/threonine protein phosphatase 1